MEGVRAEAERRGEEEEEAPRPAEAGMRRGIEETDPEKEGASG